MLIKSSYITAAWPGQVQQRIWSHNYKKKCLSDIRARDFPTWKCNTMSHILAVWLNVIIEPCVFSYLGQAMVSATTPRASKEDTSTAPTVVSQRRRMWNGTRDISSAWLKAPICKKVDFWVLSQTHQKMVFGECRSGSAAILERPYLTSWEFLQVGPVGTVWSTCTLLECFHSKLLYTSIPPHFGGKFTFPYSDTFFW